MEIITQELKKMTTLIESLKEDNRQFTDKADEQWEQIHDLTEENKELTIKFAQKSRETDTYSSNLSHEANGMRSKIHCLEKQNKELSKQVSQQKKNNIVSLENKVALLEDELSKRPPAPAQAEVSTQEQGTQIDESLERLLSLGQPQPRTSAKRKYTSEQKMKHFMKLINQHYEWIDPSSIAINSERAQIPFEFIIGRIHRISGTKESGISKYYMKGSEAYWPDQTVMIHYLKNEQKKRYGDWKCSSKKDVYSYNGNSETFKHMRFDLKEK